MNQEKIKQINDRIEEINRLSNNRGRIIDGYVISNEYLEEYSDLKSLLEILKENNTRISDIPYVSYDDVMIREDLIDDYNKLINMVNLNKKNSNTDLQKSKADAMKKIDILNISDDDKDEYKRNIESANNEQDIHTIINTAKNQNNINNKKLENDKLIPGTKISMPRERKKDEGIEDYEEYLKDHYRPYGYVEDNVIYFPETSIPIPRRPYPHENDFQEKDSYYNEMVRYYADRYKAYIKSKDINRNYTGSIKPGQEIAVIDDKNKDYTGPVKPGQELAIIDDKKNNPNETGTLDEEEHEVKRIRKAINFLKKHKKKIIIGLGLTSLALAFVPGVAPAIMVANSRLWACAPSILQPVLHACNVLLSIPAGATEVSTGLWAISGKLINDATATASVSIIKSLALSATAFAGTASIVKTIKITMGSIKNKLVQSEKWIKNKWDNRKNDNEEILDDDYEDEEEIINEKKNTGDNSKDLIEQLNNKRSQIISMMENPINQGQIINLQNNIQKLDRAVDIISDGKNTAINKTEEFMGYRINPNNREELEDILNQFGIIQAKNNNEPEEKINTKEKLEQMKDIIKNSINNFKQNKENIHSDKPENLILDEGVPPMPIQDNFMDKDSYERARLNWWKDYGNKVHRIDVQTEEREGKRK